MAKPLTKAQKAAQTRKRNAFRDTPAVPRDKSKTLILTADEFLARLEKIISEDHGGQDARAYSSDAGAYPVPRITEAAPQKGNLASGQSAPVSVLIDDVHIRTSGLRSKLEALRDSLVHGIHPDAPREKGPGVQGAQPSQGPQKDALNWAFSNLAASEDLVEEIARYLLNN